MADSLRAAAVPVVVVAESAAVANLTHEVEQMSTGEDRVMAALADPQQGVLQVGDAFRGKAAVKAAVKGLVEAVAAESAAEVIDVLVVVGVQPEATPTAEESPPAEG